jgi:hypothetical protein
MSVEGLYPEDRRAACLLCHVGRQKFSRQETKQVLTDFKLASHDTRYGFRIV